MPVPSHYVLIYFGPSEQSQEDATTVFERLDQYTGAAKVTKDTFTTVNDIVNLLQNNRYDLLELVGDGSPSGFCGFDIIDLFGQLGNILQNRTTNGGKIVLNACNTANSNLHNECVVQSCVDVTGRRTGGLRGYGKWGTYIESVIGTTGVAIKPGGLNHTVPYHGSDGPYPGAPNQPLDGFDCYRFIEPI